MKTDVKALWVEALRSGQYKQGQHLLHNAITEEFCCLGVLCDVAVKAGLSVEVTRSQDPSTNHEVHYDRAHGALPEAVKNWAGLDSRDPILGRATASGMNDIYHASFTLIADLIDEYL